MSANWKSVAASVALLMTQAGNAMALPAELNGLQLRGQGTLRWFGFKLYDSALYTPAAQPFQWARPFALEIRYARSIPGARLVETSLEEMLRYGMPERVRAAWGEHMRRAFPDVQEGDVLIGAMDGEVVRFWFNGRQTHRIDDPLFGQLFFRIWLDPASRAPAVREQLLGGRG